VRREKRKKKKKKKKKKEEEEEEEEEGSSSGSNSIPNIQVPTTHSPSIIEEERECQMLGQSLVEIG